MEAITFEQIEQISETSPLTQNGMVITKFENDYIVYNASDFELSEPDPIFETYEPLIK